MLLVDVNILINAVHTASPDHERAKRWLDARAQGGEQIAIPWIVAVAFIRITTNPRIAPQPYSLDEALHQLGVWLALPNVSVLEPGPDHARHFAEQCRAAGATGNFVTDAHLAALAIERGCELASNDTDFGRFPALR